MSQVIKGCGMTAIVLLPLAKDSHLTEPEFRRDDVQG